MHSGLCPRQPHALADIARQAAGHDRVLSAGTFLDGPRFQYGIGIVSARIAEIVLGDEHAAIPIGTYQHAFGVTLSLPTIVGRAGVVSVLEPELGADERAGWEKSARTLRAALERVRV